MKPAKTMQKQCQLFWNGKIHLKMTVTNLQHLNHSRTIKNQSTARARTYHYRLGKETSIKHLTKP